jgi:hypothetical protein
LYHQENFYSNKSKNMRQFINYFFIALIAVFAINCKDDKEEEAPVLDAPGIAVPTGTTVKVEEVVSMDFAVTAPGKIAEITVAASDGEAVILEAASFVGQTSGTVTVSYTAPISEGTKIVTLTVKDQQVNPKSTSAEAEVGVGALAAPSITVPTDTEVLVGEEVVMEYAITAAGIIAEVTVAASEGAATVDVGDVIGKTEGTVTVTYSAPLSVGEKTVTLTVKDQQSAPKTVDGPAAVAVSVKAESVSDLLVTQFASAPIFDGQVDDIWMTAQKLVSKTLVPTGKGNRNTYYNADGLGEEAMDIFEAYEGEGNDFTMRSGIYGEDIYFLIEWADEADSKDRQSWYFDASTKHWKGEHKYANAADDKYYEDKFAFLFPIGTVDGFDNETCYASCHQASSIEKTGDKHTRHYLTVADQKIDMWHWKRVRGTHNDRVDDQRIQYVAPPYTSSSNGRGGDPDSGAGARSGYSNNSQTLNNGVEEVSVPLYVVPGGTDYYWIPQGQLGNEAKLVTAVDAEGVLTYEGGTIDPTGDAGYNQGTGDKRFPSILTRDFLGERADVSIKASHNGTGWVAELKRKLNTGDPWDVVFDPTTELRFGFAIFDNAAIAHGIKPGLNLKFEE